MTSSFSVPPPSPTTPISIGVSDYRGCGERLCGERYEATAALAAATSLTRRRSSVAREPSTVLGGTGRVAGLARLLDKWSLFLQGHYLGP